MNSQAIVHEGKKLNLLPFTFLDKIGGAINKHFEEGHTIIQEMYSDREEYAKRGIFLLKQEKESVPAYALTTKEINFLRDNYNKSQEIF